MSVSDTPDVQPDQVQGMVDQGWTLLDVRTDEEWAQGRIPGSVHVSMDEIVEKVSQLGRQVICVCAVGGRSKRVTQYLNLQGLDARNLDGGVEGWAAAGLPIES